MSLIAIYICNKRIRFFRFWTYYLLICAVADVVVQHMYTYKCENISTYVARATDFQARERHYAGRVPEAILSRERCRFRSSRQCVNAMSQVLHVWCGVSRVSCVGYIWYLLTQSDPVSMRLEEINFISNKFYWIVCLRVDNVGAFLNR